MHLISDDKGRQFDLDDMLGSYDYVMAFLVDNGAPNMVLSCLQRIAPMRGSYDMNLDHYIVQWVMNMQNEIARLATELEKARKLATDDEC